MQMINIAKATSAFLCFVQLASCVADTVPVGAGEYISYLENEQNSLRKMVSSGSCEYKVQLATHEYMAIKESLNSYNGINTAERINELKGTIFFIVYINCGATSESGKEEQLQYYSNMPAGDIELKCGASVFRPVSFHFEDNYNLAPYNTLVIAFNMPEGNSPLELVVNDRYAGNLLLKFTFDPSAISKIPPIKIQ